MHKFSKIAIYYLKHVNVVFFVLVFYGLVTLVSNLAVAISDFYGEGSSFIGANLSQLHYIQKFIVVVIMAPIVETAIFQYSVIKVAYNFSNNKIWGIFLSSLCFAFAHLYSLAYFITGILVGLIFAICFSLSEQRRESSLILVSSVHALYNLHAFILNAD